MISDAFCSALLFPIMRTISASKKKLLQPVNATQLWELWGWIHQTKMGLAYIPITNKAHETALLKNVLVSWEPMQLAYAMVSFIRDWERPQIPAFVEWFLEAEHDELIHDVLQARAYFLFDMTRDRSLATAIERFDEAEAAQSWGHPADIGKARSELERACSEVTD